RLFGAAGRITVERGDRRRLLRRPADGVEAGLGYVGAARAQGIVQGASVRDNILLAALDRAGRGPGGVWWSRAAADAIVGALMDALDIRPRDPDRPVRELSGGNQQKLLFARWLAAEVTVLLLDEPTQGIDVKAKGQIQRLIREFAARGGGVVFASTDFSEVLSTSDAVLAMRQGAVVALLKTTIAAGVAAGIAAGALVGLANGLVITALNVNPFITTLGTMVLIRGVVFLLTGGQAISGAFGLPDAFVRFGAERVLG